MTKIARRARHSDRGRPRSRKEFEREGDKAIPEFEDPDLWIHHDLWAKTVFDSDGRPDRTHVDVAWPRQTDSQDLKLTVIYISSPYFGGTSTTAREFFWDVRYEPGATPPQRRSIVTKAVTAGRRRARN